MNAHQNQVQYLQAPPTCGFADEEGLPTIGTAILPCVSDVSSDEEDFEHLNFFLHPQDESPEIKEALRDLDTDHHHGNHYDQQLVNSSGLAITTNLYVAHLQEAETEDEALNCLLAQMPFIHEGQQVDIHEMYEALRALDTDDLEGSQHDQQIADRDSKSAITNDAATVRFQVPYRNQGNSAVISNEQPAHQVKQMATQAPSGDEALDCLIDPFRPLSLINDEQQVDIHDLNEALRALDTDHHHGNQHQQQPAHCHTGWAIASNPTVAQIDTPYPDQATSAVLGIKRNPTQVKAKHNQGQGQGQGQAPRPHVIETLTEFDIARGRPGNLAKNHPANRYFLRPFLGRYSMEYSRQGRGHKRALAYEMLHQLQSDGYRFVTKRRGSLGGWIEIRDREQMVDQIMHALRDGIKKGFLPAIE
ncbi:MAG: hypothetical protein SGBAC_004659 [Bacillariaceae sp.]